MTTTKALAEQLGVDESDVLALADQLTTLDGSEAVVSSETRDGVTLTPLAEAVIRDQLRAPAAGAAGDAGGGRR